MPARMSACVRIWRESLPWPYLPLPIVQAFSHRFGPAYLVLRLSALECLTSFTGGMTYYAVC